MNILQLSTLLVIIILLSDRCSALKFEPYREDTLTDNDVLWPFLYETKSTFAKDTPTSEVNEAELRKDQTQSPKAAMTHENTKGKESNPAAEENSVPKMLNLKNKQTLSVVDPNDAFESNSVLQSNEIEDESSSSEDKNEETFNKGVDNTGDIESLIAPDFDYKCSEFGDDLAGK